ncbi:hypothetical protein GGS20DRAFT_268492 [Poronia punctata]|nr:hypothetical protein GGS20DRAFT_268492 [Poronia punctata]
MSGGWKDIVKNGWHPEKEGSPIKDQVKGLVGRGDKAIGREGHVAAPISSLRDPSSFGPPPKHVASYGQSTSRTASPASSGSHTPARSHSVGGGSVTSQTHGPTQQQAQNVGEAPPPPEPKPYRVDTTGLSTAHLPLPPGRRDGSARQPPQKPPVYSQPATTATATKPKVPPSLPPRLPPRSENNSPSPSRLSTSTQETGTMQLNQGAIDRLGNAGISVPGLGIGDRTTGSAAQTTGFNQIDELQARVARMATPSSEVGIGKTVSENTQSSVIGPTPSVLGKKKPPPPRPKKPASLGKREDDSGPPPVPIATRPTFN